VRFDVGRFVFRERGSPTRCSYYVALEQFAPGRGAVRLESLSSGDILGLDARCIETVQAWTLNGAGVRAGAGRVRRELSGRAARARGAGAVSMRVRMQRLDVYRAEQG